LGLDEQQVVDEKNLAVAIAAFFPFPLASCEINARENAVIQAVSESFAVYNVGEFGLHVPVFPLFSDRQLAIGSCVYLQQHAPGVEAGGKKNAVRWQNDRLSALGPIAGPDVVPEHIAGGRIMPASAAGVNRDNLSFAGQGREHGRTETRFVSPGAPCRRAVLK